MSLPPQEGRRERRTRERERELEEVSVSAYDASCFTFSHMRPDDDHGGDATVDDRSRGASAKDRGRR
jgi:hypothetical protein